MNCNACTTAAERQHYEFFAGCRGCCARSIARSPQYFEARKAGIQTHAYRRILEQIGAQVTPALEHAEVIAAAAADATLREEATA
jgi:predicted  nucleic acid-binding Zn-ribbon protein